MPTSPFSQRTDFEADAKLALTDQLRRDIMQKISAIFAGQIQDIETVAFQVLDGRGIDSAIGVQLDGLGGNVGEPRNGAGDDAYRIRIKARLLINRCSGTPDQVIAIAQLLLGIGSAPKVTEYFPAAFILDATGTALTAEQAVALVNAIDEATAAGVRSQTVYGSSPGTSLFRFSASGASESNASKGFSDLAQITGGKLAGVYANG